MPNIGPMEIAIVAVIALLVLGPKRLPSAGRSLGAGIREFKDSVDWPCISIHQTLSKDFRREFAHKLE